jgi:hypothetical protein
MNKIFKIIVVSSLLVVLFGICMFIRYAAVIINNIHDKSSYFFYNGNEHLVAHAGGAIDGNVYTDSREAIENAIKYGHKFIEIDFIKSSDGAYVAGHDWELVNKMTNREDLTDKPQSLKEYKNAKILNKYTTLDETDVAELMEKYPDWIMLIDKARDIEQLAKSFPYKDRIILQVYGLHRYFKALKYGFKYPVLRLKGGRRGIKGIYKIAIDWLNIKGVILGEKSFNKNIDYIKELHNKGVAVILYGNPSFKIVESPELIKKYANEYIDLVDSDTVSSL